ncbi:MAG: hypothetical protein ACN2B6_09695 [Rickettsiales bacterium]
MVVVRHIALLCACLMLTSGAANAQSAPSANSETLPENNNEPIKIGSLFFTPEETADINYAMNIYKKNSSGRRDDGGFDEEDFLNRLTGIRKAQETNRYYKYPQFFLESIVYHAEDNWIIWVNGQKLTQSSPMENTDLSVMEINEDMVRLKWKPVSMHKVNETWQKMENDNVEVYKRRGEVIFTLRVNQTFSSYVMNILEGKVQPVTVDTHNISLEPPSEVLDPSPVDSGDPFFNQEDDDPSRTGLGGLIDAYSKLGSGEGDEVKE